jgi:signal transduction histidine kinase
MQAESMAVLAQRDSTLPAEAVLRISDEVGLLSKAALTDLRAMVHELRPSSTAELGGLEEAIRALAASAANRTGLRFRLSLGQGLERVTGEQAEDVYRILAEAIHNVVKHAAASRVTIQLTVSGDKLSARVTDYGCGITVDSSGGGPDTGYGLKTMRERAERWRGTVTVKPRREGGTVVRLSLPLAVGVPLDPTGPPPGTRPTSPATDPQ